MKDFIQKIKALTVGSSNPAEILILQALNDLGGKDSFEEIYGLIGEGESCYEDLIKEAVPGINLKRDSLRAAADKLTGYKEPLIVKSGSNSGEEIILELSPKGRELIDKKGIF